MIMPQCGQHISGVKTGGLLGTGAGYFVFVIVCFSKKHSLFEDLT